MPSSRTSTSPTTRTAWFAALLCAVANSCDAFPYATMMARSLALQSTTPLHATSSSLPDLQALQTAPFMQQVQFGMELTSLLMNDENDVQLKESLKAQLSHSDGIRGFMVAYLSGNEGNTDENDDDNKIPHVLLEALQEQFQSRESTDDLVSLMCMNVIMPTAVVTMHEDAKNSANSARTARRGLTLLQAVKEESPAFAQNLKAIQTVAQRRNSSGNTQQSKKDDDDALVKTWNDFFDKWGYQEQQAKDIEEAMNKLLL